MKIRNSLFVLAPFLLSACVGASLSNKGSLEEYPLRMARKSEAKQLKTCLKKVYAIQDQHHLKSGKYFRKIRELPVDDECSGYKMAMRSEEDGFEAMAQFTEDENTVRWSVNQTGTIEEHLDGVTTEDDMLTLE